jgi:hypothetical protein
LRTPHTGKPKTSDIRTEVKGLHNIQMYCKTNSLEKVMPTFIQKTGFDGANG